jgi:prepilin-type N-terminal cleavage/methylation domain-containing protein
VKGAATVRLPTRPEDPADAGFTLVEVLVSLGVIGVVLTAVSTFFVRSMVIANLEGSRQSAVQVAATAMEELRSVPGVLALGWLASNAQPVLVPMSAQTYTRSWDVPPLSPLISATVHITWISNGCTGGACQYSATTLISTAAAEPVFDPATTP